jgi:riboflavin synthase
MRYIFPKGYIAINGASLTVSATDTVAGWFEIWLIPETRRMTTFEQKTVGDWLNIEIERGTQVVVDAVRASVEETLGNLRPALEAFLAQRGAVLEDLIVPVTFPR